MIHTVLKALDKSMLPMFIFTGVVTAKDSLLIGRKLPQPLRYSQQFLPIMLCPGPSFQSGLIWIKVIRIGKSVSAVM